MCVAYGLHCFHSNGTKKLIYSRDTDVYHIGLTQMSKMPHSEVIVQLSKSCTDEAKFVHMNSLLRCLQNDPDLAQIPESARPQAIQTLYVATGCDYTSFFSGLGKVSFLSTFFQHASFIAGTIDTNISGSIGHVSLDTKSDAYLSFLRLVGCAYFRKHTSAFQLQTPEALFHSIPATNGALDSHSKWLSKIRSTVRQRPDRESDSMPSTEALGLHWKRCVWVLQMWNCATHNDIYLPGKRMHYTMTYNYYARCTYIHTYIYTHINVYSNVYVVISKLK